jgi:hypothetical protein
MLRLLGEKILGLLIADLIFRRMPLLMMSVQLILMEETLATQFTSAKKKRPLRLLLRTRKVARLPEWILMRMSYDIVITEMFWTNEGFHARMTLKQAARGAMFGCMLLQLIFPRDELNADSVRDLQRRSYRAKACSQPSC